MCLVQISWLFTSVNYDLNNNYSASRDVAEFLEQNNYETIYGLDFDIVAIQLYFEQNIFKNLNTEKSFWFWVDDNGYTKEEDLLENDNAVFVFSEFYYNPDYEIYSQLLEKEYIEFHFTGAMFTKDSIHENKGYYVLVPVH